MAAIDAHTVRGIMGGLGVIFGYGFSLWRIFKRNRGDRFIEFGLSTTMLLLVVADLHRFPNMPDWVEPAILPLVFVFCTLSIFFGLQQGYRALRDRNRNTS